MKKAIFLDLDGPIFINGEINEDAVYCLSELIRLTNAYIIITSSWRIGKTIDQLISDLSKYPKFPVEHIKGLTDVINYKTVEIPRGAEISIYLEEHQEIENYVIIDDEIIPLLSQKDHFVQTGIHGFIGEYFREALRILG